MSDEQFFHEFEHTGDIGIEVEAPSRGELFARAALALGRIMVAPDAVAAREERIVRAVSARNEELMHDLLAAALNVFLCDGFIWREAEGREEPDAVALRLVGEPFDPRRHELLTEVKAVTYHELKVAAEHGVWSARIVFDV